jgi:hypothetical protein
MSHEPKVPKAVEDAERKANELWEKQYGKTVKPATDPNIEPLEDETPAQVKPDETPPETPPETEPEETPAPEQEPEPEPAPLPPAEDFKHKFEVLQGKYNAEVPGMAYELAQARQEIKELKAKPKEEPKPEPKLNLETDEKLKAFKAEYPDVFEAVEKLNKAFIQESLSKIDEKLNRVEKTVGTVTETFGQNERERFKADLDKDTDVGKDWRVVNKEKEFIGYLQTKDVYTGKTKHELLTDAWNRMDSDATLQFFKDFKATKSSKPAPKSKGTDVDPKKIDPPKGGSGGPNIDTNEKGKPTITPRDVKKFYEDVADPNGPWKGKQAEAEKEERRLLKAIGVIK